jgi:Protein of unknown function (DUF1493)
LVKWDKAQFQNPPLQQAKSLAATLGHPTNIKLTARNEQTKMRNTNIGMVRIYGAEKVHDRFYGQVSIFLVDEEVKLSFGTDEQGYCALKNAIQFQPFDNKTNEPYRHFFAGVFDKNRNEMKVRVEQGKTNKEFWVKCSSMTLAKNLMWFRTIKDKEEVKYLLDISDDKMFADIKKFTAEKVGVEIEKLTRQTRVETDLGIAGLDTISFFDEFLKSFKVNCPNGFSYDKYVTSENLNPLGFFKSLFSKQHRDKDKIIELTLGDLERAALTKTWNEL